MADTLRVSPVVASPIAPSPAAVERRALPAIPTPATDPVRALGTVNGGTMGPHALAGLAAPGSTVPRRSTDLRVLTLNIQVDASGGRLPAIVAMIRQANADIIGLQECGAEVSAEIARQLGYHVVQVGDDTPVLSRYPLDPAAPGKSGVTAHLPNGQRVMFMNLHLGHAPYQPFQLLRIPYADGRFISTEAEAISEARLARGAQVDRAVAELEGRDREAASVIVCDCNQPSHTDWTERAAAAGRHPIAVRWPESRAFVGAGFVDAYRRLFPDEMARPGFTWTPGKDPSDPTDHPDRLDFVYSDRMTPRQALIVGESAANADIVVTPYPTDHRGVIVDFELPR